MVVNWRTRWARIADRPGYDGRDVLDVGYPGTLGNVGSRRTSNPWLSLRRTPALPSELPVVPLRDAVVLPMTVAPLGVSRPISVEAVNRALAGDRMVLLLLQKNDAEEPAPDDLHRVGTVGVIRQMAKAPSGMRVLVEGIVRARAEFLQQRQAASCTRCSSRCPSPRNGSIEIDAHVRRLQELVDRALSLATGLSPDVKTLVSTIDDPLRIVYLLASLLDMKRRGQAEAARREQPDRQARRGRDGAGARDRGARAEGADSSRAPRRR